MVEGEAAGETPKISYKDRVGVLFILPLLAGFPRLPHGCRGLSGWFVRKKK